MDRLYPRTSPPHTNAWKEWALIATGVICLLLTLRPDVASDGEIRFQAVEAWLSGVGGIQIKYSLVQPALSMPLAWLAKAMGAQERSVVPYFNVLIFLMGACYLYQLLKRIYSPQVARLSFLIICSGSMLPHHLQWYFGEVLTAILLAIGALATKRLPWVATISFAVGLANSPALIIPFGGAAAIYFLRARRWAPVLGLGIAITIALLENFLKFGTLVGNPYLADAEHGFQTVLPYSGKPGFSYPFFLGAISILFSFGKGLIFFIPGILLLFNKDIRRRLGGTTLERSTMILFSALVIALYSKWWAWYGGGFWGPRFFLFLCFPAALLMALAIVHPEQSRRFLAFMICIVALSTWVGVDGYVFGQMAMDVCWENHFAAESMCWYTPEYSALWRPFITGDIGGVWDHPRTLFALWQCVTCGYLIIFLHRSFSNKRASRNQANEVF